MGCASRPLDDEGSCAVPWRHSSIRLAWYGTELLVAGNNREFFFWSVRYVRRSRVFGVYDLLKPKDSIKRPLCN